MIRVTPTKLQLTAEDSSEYDRHKAIWNTKKEGGRDNRERGEKVENSEKSDKVHQQEEAEAYRASVRARLGITSSSGSSR